MGSASDWECPECMQRVRALDLPKCPECNNEEMRPPRFIPRKSRGSGLAPRTPGLTHRDSSVRRFFMGCH